MQGSPCFVYLPTQKMKALENFQNIHDAFIAMSEDVPQLHRRVIYEFSQCGKMVYQYPTHKAERSTVEAWYYRVFGHFGSLRK